MLFPLAIGEHPSENSCRSDPLGFATDQIWDRGNLNADQATSMVPRSSSLATKRPWVFHCQAVAHSSRRMPCLESRYESRHDPNRSHLAVSDKGDLSMQCGLRADDYVLCAPASEPKPICRFASPFLASVRRKKRQGSSCRSSQTHHVSLQEPLVSDRPYPID